MSINKKTLWIGPNKDMSGYARASRNYLRLFQNEINMVARAVRYDSGNKQSLSLELAQLHTKSAQDAEVIIQMLTPNEMRPIQGKKNIAICCWETDKIPQHWVDQLNKFNVVIVPCEANKTAFEQSGVKTKIIRIPFVFFKEDYIINKEKFTIPGIGPDTIKYYNISQWSQKKGIDALIKSYYLAFQNDEDVILVLKGYIGMQNQQGDAQKLVNQISNIRNGMRLLKYPKIYITETVMSEQDVLKLHNTCDIYVNLSRGEGWGVPPFEALLMGKELISVNHTGMNAYLDSNIDTDKFYAGDYYKVNSYKEPVFNMTHGDPTLYTSLDNWYEPDILSAIYMFKDSYNTIEKRNKYSEQWFKMVDPINIKKQLMDIINA